MESKTRSLRIVHFSDIHCGSQYFVPNLLDRTLVEINDLAPEMVVLTGDLTNMGYRQEFREAREYLDRLECNDVLVVPGNHDSRNVGYMHFERLFSKRDSVVSKSGVTVLGIDSTEPDLDYGRVGRHRYSWIEDQYAEHPDDFKIFALHHHLLPVPGTGRERNVVHDAGDVLEVLITAGVKLVLSGHKHVPYAWRLEDMFVVNTGTVSTLRLRGNTKPCYNVVEINGDRVTITRNYPFHGGEVIVEFDGEATTYVRHDFHLDRIITDV
ncbi:MAG: metallophosphoesterase family protein [Thermoleophilia bacterium]|jgi:3',5'-cyclic AMP phosphodiesterase CpdA